MNENGIGLHFGDGHVEALDPIKALSEVHEFVEVGGEEGSALDLVVEVFYDCARDGKAIESRSAPSDLIYNGRHDEEIVKSGTKSGFVPRIAKDLEVARLRMAAVSIISTMNVDWLRARSSDAPG